LELNQTTDLQILESLLQLKFVNLDWLVAAT